MPFGKGRKLFGLRPFFFFALVWCSVNELIVNNPPLPLTTPFLCAILSLVLVAQIES